jgi:2-C-methyl-D-erythritol 2,4-cyclodiphosphate synthase
MDFRVGIGFDAHALAPGRRLVLGGVVIPHHLGLAGHSDGDVLVHAIMDALLGAAGLGDKGVYFPSSDPQYRDISSLVLLRRVGELVSLGGWRVSNVDATMLAQNPKLGPFIAAMKEQVSATLALPAGRVSIKATTTDYLGFTGRAEGIAACAVASLVTTP